MAFFSAFLGTVSFFMKTIDVQFISATCKGATFQSFALCMYIDSNLFSSRVQPEDDIDEDYLRQ